MNNEQETILLGIVGIKNMGAYDSETKYEKLNVVTYQGSSYCALKETIGNLPTNTEYWQLYAEKGEQGIQGPQGSQGPRGPRGDTGNPGSSPIAVSSVDDMTDTSRIYVNTTDGHWYWYDTDNTQWTDGGEYQATGISNGSITGIKTNFLNDSFNILKIEDKSGSSNGIDYTISNGVITLDGTAETTFYINANIEPKVLNGPYRFTVGGVSGASGVTVAIVSDDATPVWVSLNDLSSDQISFCRGLNYIQLRIRIPDETVLNNVILHPMIYKEEYYKTGIPYIPYDEKLSTNHILDIGKKVITPENTTFISKTANLVNPDNIVNGFCQGTSSGKLVIQASEFYYNYTVFNDTNQTKTYYIYPKYRMYVISSNRTTGESTLPADTNVTTASSVPAFIEVPAYSRLNVTFPAAVTDPMIAESSEAINYVPFRYMIPHLYYDVDLSNLNSQIATLNSNITDLQNSNILYGKKLVACGDSFTAYTNATYDSGRFQGHDKVWPYIIGLRNNMEVNNMAVSGSCMTNIVDGTRVRFSDTKYTQIPDDADYIIIKYGINDLNISAPIGTIDSNDDTTFYGAWNKVMPYIIEHHPTAKIGIIVTNGLGVDTSALDNSNYAHAIIEIAKKFGIPTLNEWNDPNVPLLIRTGRTDVLNTIREMRKNTFKVSADNTHENYICHEYESTIIEDFLRRL